MNIRIAVNQKGALLIDVTTSPENDVEGDCPTSQENVPEMPAAGGYGQTSFGSPFVIPQTFGGGIVGGLGSATNQIPRQMEFNSGQAGQSLSKLEKLEKLENEYPAKEAAYLSKSSGCSSRDETRQEIRDKAAASIIEEFAKMGITAVRLN